MVFKIFADRAQLAAFQMTNSISLVLRDGTTIPLYYLFGGFEEDDARRLWEILSAKVPVREVVMRIFPAIDLRDGKCVRLRQGDYSQETIFGTDPGEMARHWVEQGATFLHVVDLDGAKEGRPINGDAIRAIVQASGVPCQLGGGLRTQEHIEEALSWGVTRVIIGTKALQSPAWLEQMARRFPGKIVLGIDAKAGKVATQGWLEVSEVPALDLAKSCAKLPLAAIIYTDISRDGMMQGANVPAMAEMAAAVRFPVIASGGVTTLDDVKRLAEARLAGCIIGRALYEGRLTVSACTLKCISG